MIHRHLRGARAVLISIAALVSACAPLSDQQPAGPATPSAPPATPAARAPSTAPATAPAPAARAGSYRTLDQYKQALARHILAANQAQTVSGDLQPLLRAVVVLEFSVDQSGNVRDVRTIRTPERDADGLARQSLTRAGALPAPPAAWLQNGRVNVTETWLFNTDGRFHLRSLGPRQRTTL